MQGVVRIYDPQTGEGLVVRDTDRADLVLAPDALTDTTAEIVLLPGVRRSAVPVRWTL